MLKELCSAYPEPLPPGDKIAAYLYECSSKYSTVSLLGSLHGAGVHVYIGLFVVPVPFPRVYVAGSSQISIPDLY